MKLEAVDLEYLSEIRVATITNVMCRTLQLFFDGQARFQYVDVDSPDIYPVGWCKRTGHSLSTPFGTSEFKVLTNILEWERGKHGSILMVVGCGWDEEPVYSILICYVNDDWIGTGLDFLSPCSFFKKK